MKCFALSLDPIHIGAGGYRLGRVDNTIVREPATDVPKIPGTSLAGTIREYTNRLMEKSNDCKDKNEKEKENYAREKAKKYFGDENRQGALRFYDAQIILFPVPSINGTVWISTEDLLIYWLNKGNKQNKENNIPQAPKDKAFIIKWDEDNKPEKINLGWLYLETDCSNDNKTATAFLPAKLDFIKRITVVSDKLFSHLVNDNLEVRTSVRIDPATGAAADGALFTYEAIPRGTVFGFEIVVDKRRAKDKDVIEIIKKSFPYLKLLGIGGMGTRGFGRLEIMDNCVGGDQNKGGNAND